jgi:hypothetical protein
VLVAVVWLLLVAILDRFVGFSPLVRAGSLVLLAGVLAYRLWPTWREALAARVDWRRESARIERLSPDLSDRLQTVASHLPQFDDPRGPSPMVARLAHELGSAVTGRDAAGLLPTRLAIRPWIGVAAAAVAMVALCFWPWLDLPSLLARQLRPWADLAAVTHTKLLVTPGDTSIIQGDGLRVRVEVANLPANAVPMLVYAPGSTDSLDAGTAAPGSDAVAVAMTPAAGPTSASSAAATETAAFEFAFATTPPADFAYRVMAGDGTSRAYRVRVLRRPAIAAVSATLKFPDYLRRPDLDLPIDSSPLGPLEAPAGTKARVTIESTEPLAAASLRRGAVRIDGEPVPDPSRPGPTTKYAFNVAVDRNDDVAIELRSVDGVESRALSPLRLRAVPDQPPTVQVPGGTLRAHPRHTLRLPYQAADDYGVEGLELLVQVNGSAVQSRPIPVGPEPRLARGEEDLSLADLGVVIGDSVAVRVRAADGSGQSAVSSELTLLIAPNTVDLASARQVQTLADASRTARELARSHKPDGEGRDSREGREGREAEDARPDADPNVLRQQLLSGMADASSADQAAALRQLVDDAEQAMTALSPAPAEAKADTRPDEARLEREAASERLARVAEQLQALAQAQQAANALADLDNAAALQEKARQAQAAAGGPNPRSRQLQQQARKLNEDALAAGRAAAGGERPADVRQRLQNKAKQGDALAERGKRLDLLAEARAWAEAQQANPQTGQQLARRLAAQSLAEAMQPDGSPEKALAQERAAQAVASAAAQQQAAPADAGSVSAARQQLAQELRQLSSDDPAERAKASESLRQQLAAKRQDAGPVDDAARKAEAAPPSPQALRELASRQRRLASKEADPSQLADEQRAVADAIDRAAPSAGSEARQAGSAGASRTLEALGRVQRALLDLPLQLDAVKQQSDARAAQADRLRAVRGDATRPSGAVAAKLAEAQLAAADAALDSAAAPLRPDAVEAMAKLLEPLEPEAAAAVRALRDELAPQSASLAKSVDARAAVTDEQVRQTRQAITSAQQKLADATAKLLDRDPLTSARFHARQAAQQLAQPQPTPPRDRPRATEQGGDRSGEQNAGRPPASQTGAGKPATPGDGPAPARVPPSQAGQPGSQAAGDGASLPTGGDAGSGGSPADARGRVARDAARPSQARAADDLAAAARQTVQRRMARQLQQSPSLGGTQPGSTSPGPGGPDAAVPNNALENAAAWWWRLRGRNPDAITAPGRETDPAGYEDALRLYFQTLNRPPGEEK